MEQKDGGGGKGEREECVENEFHGKRNETLDNLNEIGLTMTYRLSRPQKSCHFIGKYLKIMNDFNDSL